MTTAITDGPLLQSSSTALRHEIEEFLYAEAELLDQWRLLEWLELFALDCRYIVPSTDKPDGDPLRDLVLVHDDRFMLEQRATSLLTRGAHAEYPHSRTRRIISNVRAAEADGVVRVSANFLLHRNRRGLVDTYAGHYEHRLLREQGVLLYSVRKAILDLDALSPHGKISIIL
jgi:p-cumate 2,3-dioxygenase beta subunit